MKKHASNYRLGRDHNARRALFKVIIGQLIEKEKMTTTATKAAATRPIFEKLLTKAKIASVAKIREIHAVIGDNRLVSKLVHEIAPRYKDIAGGYTKITRYGTRKGDNAPMVIWSLTKQKTQETKSQKTTTKETKPAKEPSVKKVTSTPTLKAKSTSKKSNAVKLAPSRAGKRGDK